MLGEPPAPDNLGRRRYVGHTWGMEPSAAPRCRSSSGRLLAALVVLGALLTWAALPRTSSHRPVPDTQPDTRHPKRYRTAAFEFRYPGNWIATASPETAPGTAAVTLTTPDESAVVLRVYASARDLSAAHAAALEALPGATAAAHTEPQAMWYGWSGTHSETQLATDHATVHVRLFTATIAPLVYLDVCEWSPSDATAGPGPGVTLVGSSLAVHAEAVLAPPVVEPAAMHTLGPITVRAPRNWVTEQSVEDTRAFLRVTDRSGLAAWECAVFAADGLPAEFERACRAVTDAALDLTPADASPPWATFAGLQRTLIITEPAGRFRVTGWITRLADGRACEVWQRSPAEDGGFYTPAFALLNDSVAAAVCPPTAKLPASVGVEDR